MRRRSLKWTAIIAGVLLLVVMTATTARVFAQGGPSSLPWVAVSSGGGVRASPQSFTLHDTLGQSPIGMSFSQNYTLVSGFQVGVDADITPIEEICGDQNDDGVVNIFDAIIDLQITVGLSEPTASQEILSDLNHNGEIDVADVIITLRHIVGLKPILDACGPE